VDKNSQQCDRQLQQLQQEAAVDDDDSAATTTPGDDNDDTEYDNCSERLEVLFSLDTANECWDNTQVGIVDIKNVFNVF